MDRNLVVQGAEGESILRLPWFEDGLFVGRELPQISEMPTAVRTRCITAMTYERMAERLDRSAAGAEQRAALHRLAGRSEEERGEQRAADKARNSADRARINARRLRSRDTRTAS